MTQDDYPMRIELMPGLTNVVRFPVEERVKPTLLLLYEIAPDPREVLSVIDAFGLAPVPWDLMDVADRRVAEEILNQVPMERGATRKAMLQAIEDGFAARGVAACRAAHEAGLAASRAQERAVTAASCTGANAVLDAEAERLTVAAAVLLVEAYVRREEAGGASRAIRLARQGQLWTRRDPDEGTQWLIDYQAFEKDTRPTAGTTTH